MTLATTHSFVRETVASGAASAAFDFAVENKSHVRVRFLTAADPDPDWLAYGVDYSVTLNVASDGGTVTFTPALEGAGDIEIERLTPTTQTRRFRNIDRFPEEAVEGGLDHVSLALQEVVEKAGRALVLPRGDAGPTELGDTPAEQSLLVYDPDTDAYAWQSVEDFTGAQGNQVLGPAAHAAASFARWNGVANSRTLLERTRAEFLGADLGLNAAQFKNRVLNGCFRVAQHLPASNADDTYALDHWVVLTQTGAVAVTQLTDPETGAANGLRLTQSQASAQRMGVAQILLSASVRDLRSAIATLAGRVRLSTGADVRYAVLEWTGTADSVTSDVVNDWTSASYTAGGFFISSNVSVRAVGEVACTAATWRDLDALQATLTASANNVILVVWTEGAAAQNVTLDFNRVQFEPGAYATEFERRPYALEYQLALFFFEKISAAAAYALFAPGYCSSSTVFRGQLRYAAKRVAPTVSFSGSFAVDKNDASQQATTGIAAAHICRDRCALDVTVASGLVAGDGSFLRANGATSYYALVDARL